eukprot:6435946-Pyramimonas_sp.AAC.1
MSAGPATPASLGAGPEVEPACASGPDPYNPRPDPPRPDPPRPDPPRPDPGPDPRPDPGLEWR